MNVNLPLKDWIGYAVMIVAMTTSYVLTNASQDKNNALMNQKLDTLIMNATTTGAQVSMINSSLNNHEVRITVLETTTKPLLSQNQLSK